MNIQCSCYIEPNIVSIFFQFTLSFQYSSYYSLQHFISLLINTMVQEGNQTLIQEELRHIIRFTKLSILQDDNNDGFKTPTSSDHKVPPILECPGAPCKKKTLITKTPMKRKPLCRRRIVFDEKILDEEIKESGYN